MEDKQQIDFGYIDQKEYETTLLALKEFLVGIGIEVERIQYIPSMGNDYIGVYLLKEYNYDSGDQTSICIGADLDFTVCFHSENQKEQLCLTLEYEDKAITFAEIKEFTKKSVIEIIEKMGKKYSLVVKIKE